MHQKDKNISNRIQCSVLFHSVYQTNIFFVLDVQCSEAYGSVWLYLSVTRMWMRHMYMYYVYVCATFSSFVMRIKVKKNYCSYKFSMCLRKYVCSVHDDVYMYNVCAYVFVYVLFHIWQFLMVNVRQNVH